MVNRAYFELLLIEVEELESVSFKVLFWHVRREFNRVQIGWRIKRWMVEEVYGELVFEVDHGGLEFLVDVSCEVSQGFCGLD